MDDDFEAELGAQVNLQPNLMEEGDLVEIKKETN